MSITVCSRVLPPHQKEVGRPLNLAALGLGSVAALVGRIPHLVDVGYRDGATMLTAVGGCGACASSIAQAASRRCPDRIAAGPGARDSIHTVPHP